MENDINDGVILAARLLLAALFLIFGWRKLTDYSGTVSRMVQDGAPLPVLATAAAIFMELPVAFAVAVGAFTRPSAVLLVLYTLGTALIAHHYWTMTSGANKIDSMESFYKNLSIVGGFLLLYITGAGKYSIDAILGLPARTPQVRDGSIRVALLTYRPLPTQSTSDIDRLVDPGAAFSVKSKIQKRRKKRVTLLCVF